MGDMSSEDCLPGFFLQPEHFRVYIYKPSIGMTQLRRNFSHLETVVLMFERLFDWYLCSGDCLNLRWICQVVKVCAPTSGMSSEDCLPGRNKFVCNSKLWR